MRILLASLLAVVATSSLHAASADDLLGRVVEQVQPEDLVPGSPARARKIEELLKNEPGLSASDTVTVRVALAEAWLDAGEIAVARNLALAALSDAAATPAQRERSGLALVATYRSQVRAATASQAVGDVGAAIDAAFTAAKLNALPKVVSAAMICEAERLLVDVEMERVAAIENGQPMPKYDAKRSAPIFAALDRAVQVLGQSEPDDRTPIFAMRIDAMDRLRCDPKVVKAWIDRHKSDPAMSLLLDTALSSADRLVGATAPALVGPRFGDDKGGRVDLATMVGKPTLVYFFASWSNPSEEVTKIVALVAAERAQAINVVGVSLDRKETIEKLTPYLLRHGILFPVIAEGLGWDSELDDIWRVESIPSIVLVDAHGMVSTRNLVERGNTRASIDRALDGLLKSATTPASR